MLSALAATCCALTALAACGSFSGSDPGGNDGDGGVADASIADGGADASSPLLDSGVLAKDASLVPVDSGDIIHDGFENGKVGDSCPGWQTQNATTTVVDGVARNGAHSCRVCITGTDGFAIAQFVASGGLSYTGELWIMPLSDAGVSGVGDGGEGVADIQFSAADQSYLGEYSSRSTLVADRWKSVQLTGTSADASAIGFLYAETAPTAPDDCWYIDDVRVYTH